MYVYARLYLFFVFKMVCPQRGEQSSRLLFPLLQLVSAAHSCIRLSVSSVIALLFDIPLLNNSSFSLHAPSLSSDVGRPLDSCITVKGFLYMKSQCLIADFEIWNLLEMKGDVDRGLSTLSISWQTAFFSSTVNLCFDRSGYLGARLRITIGRNKAGPLSMFDQMVDGRVPDIYQGSDVLVRYMLWWDMVLWCRSCNSSLELFCPRIERGLIIP